MCEPGESKRKQGRVTVLALLFGLLLGFSGTTPTRFDSNTARLGNGEILRVASGVRSGARAGEDRPDTDDGLALLPPSPRVVTELVSVRPAAPIAPSVGRSASLDPQFHYHARAPPARLSPPSNGITTIENPPLSAAPMRAGGANAGVVYVCFHLSSDADPPQPR